MIINGFEVSFFLNNNNVWISFDKYSGSLKELIDFRKSFDYECYQFGNAVFSSAKWKTIIADDHEHQSYPREISLSNHEGEMIINWIDFEHLLAAAKIAEKELQA